jgi:hypothetical protein
MEIFSRLKNRPETYKSGTKNQAIINGVTCPSVSEVMCASTANMRVCGEAIYASSHLIQHFDWEKYGLQKIIIRHSKETKLNSTHHRRIWSWELREINLAGKCTAFSGDT